MSHSSEEYELTIKMMARELMKKSEHPGVLITSDDGEFAVHINSRRVVMGKVYTSVIHRANQVDLGSGRDLIDLKPIILEGGHL